MAMQMKLIYTAVLLFTTGLYGLICFGILSADFAEDLTTYGLCITYIGVVVVNSFFALVQLISRKTVGGTYAPTLLVLGAIGSYLVALASIFVVIVELTLTRASALRAIDLARDASLIVIGLSVLFALCAIGLSFNQSVEEAVREFNAENE